MDVGQAMRTESPIMLQGVQLVRGTLQTTLDKLVCLNLGESNSFSKYEVLVRRKDDICLVLLWKIYEQIGDTADWNHNSYTFCWAFVIFSCSLRVLNYFGYSASLPTPRVFQNKHTMGRDVCKAIYHSKVCRLLKQRSCKARLTVKVPHINC